MRDSIFPSDGHPKYGSPPNLNPHNETIFVKTQKESTSTIELENDEGEEIDNENKHEDDYIRKVYNKDLADGSKGYTEKDTRINIDNKDNGLNRFFNTDQNQSNPPITWVQFQAGSGREIPTGGGEPLHYDPSSRNSFVKFVLFIVFVMLLCTTGFNVLVYMTPVLKHFYLRMGLLIAIPAMILILALSYAMTCISCARQVPCNYICLFLAVIGMSNICAFITVRYNTSLILLAVVATTAVVFVCMLLACSRFDFTKWMLYIVVISSAFVAIALVVSLTMLITGTYFKTLHLIILIIGTIINVVVLTMELQTILGGKAVEISEDDYALAAFLLYTSIIDIFLKMLQIFGLCGELD